MHEADTVGSMRSGRRLLDESVLVSRVATSKSRASNNFTRCVSTYSALVTLTMSLHSMLGFSLVLRAHPHNDHPAESAVIHDQHPMFAPLLSPSLLESAPKTMRAFHQVILGIHQISDWVQHHFRLEMQCLLSAFSTKLAGLDTDCYSGTHCRKTLEKDGGSGRLSLQQGMISSSDPDRVRIV